MPNPEVTNIELQLRWLFNLAWVEDLSELAIAGYCSGNVCETTQELIVAGHESTVLDNIRTEAYRYVNGEIF